MVAVGCVVLPGLTLRAMSRVCSWEAKSASCHTGSESELCLACWEDELLTWWVKLCCNVPLPSGLKDCGKKGLLWDGLAWPSFPGKKGAMGQAGTQLRPVVYLLPA